MPTGQKRSHWVFGLVAIIIVLCVGIPVTVATIFVNNAKTAAAQTQCINNLRRLAIAQYYYAQDHQVAVFNGNLPGSNWVEELLPYVDATTNSDGSSVLMCSKAKNLGYANPIGYGYNAMLIRPDGTGINEALITRPTEVGLCCDADPVCDADKGGGIVGEYGLAFGNTSPKRPSVHPANRHRGGIAIAYVDGHAACESRGSQSHNVYSAVTRAFWMANALGFVNNPVAGMPDFTAVHPCTTAVTIGGDPETAALLVAACAAMKIKTPKFSFSNTGFAGVKSSKGRSANYIWGDASGVKPTGNAVAIAKDSVVFIVNRNSALPRSFCNKEKVKTHSNCYVMDEKKLQQLLSTAPPDAMLYTFAPADGTRAYVERTLSLKILGNDKSTVTTVRNAVEMNDKVASDPRAIGYCSLAMVDVKRVAILGIRRGNSLFVIPWEEDEAAIKAWPYQRTLYARCGGAAWRPATRDGIGNIMLAPGGAGTKALQAGPLFQVSYQKP